MPNWCSNVLLVKGPGAEDFPEKAKGRPARYRMSKEEKKLFSEPIPNIANVSFTFNSLVPVPKKVLQTGYNDGGYNWQIENWGTKWDVDPEEMIAERISDGWQYVFSTAWSPPKYWAQKASRKLPELLFEISYHEIGCMFCGKFVFQGGQIVSQQEFEEDNDEFWTFMESEFGLFREDFFDPEEEEQEEEEAL